MSADPISPQPNRPVAIATVHCDVPGEMTLAEYRRMLSGRSGRRRRRRLGRSR
jgi:hypothetical protein